jgi:hypothetical protein
LTVTIETIKPLIDHRSPLFVWKLVMIAVVLAVALFVYLDPMIVRNYRINYILSRKLDSIRFAEGETGIVFLGNSLLRKALPASEAQIASLISKQLRNSHNNPGPVTVVSLMTGHESSQNLQSIAGKLIELRPAMIVIQTELVVARNRKETKWGRFWSWGRELHALMAAYLPGTQEVERPERVLDVSTTPARIDVSLLRKVQTPQEFHAEGIKKVWNGQTVSMRNPDYLNTRMVIDRIRQKKIKLVVIEPPIDELAATYAPKGYFEKRSDVVRSVLDPRLDGYLRYPSFFPHSDFKDSRHLNIYGGKKFLSWCIPALVNELVRDSQ